MNTFKSMLLIIFILLSACQDSGYLEQKTQGEAQGQTAQKLQGSKEGAGFTGYDMKGEKQTCPPMNPEMACTMMMAPSDFFGMECREQGLKAYQCGCHYWLCEKPIKFENRD